MFAAETTNNQLRCLLKIPFFCSQFRLDKEMMGLVKQFGLIARGRKRAHWWMRTLWTVIQPDSGSRLLTMISQRFNAGAKVMGPVMAALREGKSQGKLQFFQLVVLLGKGDGRSRGGERFHGFTFFLF